MQGLNYPMKTSEMKKFEAQNNISVYVYGYEEQEAKEEKGITPIYCSKYDHPQRVFLLLYKGHYCTIRSLDRLVSDKNGHHSMSSGVQCACGPSRKKKSGMNIFPGAGEETRRRWSCQRKKKPSSLPILKEV